MTTIDLVGMSNTVGYNRSAVYELARTGNLDVEKAKEFIKVLNELDNVYMKAKAQNNGNDEIKAHELKTVINRKDEAELLGL